MLLLAKESFDIFILVLCGRPSEMLRCTVVLEQYRDSESQAMNIASMFSVFFLMIFVN